jgi:hypothetical protein
MPADNPTKSEKEKLQRFYLASRSLIQDNIVPDVCVQRSFEEAIAGFQGEDVWRPTHISRAAVFEAVEGQVTNIQRAHGVVGDRMDRYDRTLSILRGEEQDFDTWWDFWRKHDSTVLITKAEHSSNRKYTFEELVELPDAALRMFVRSGFSFKMRKKHELKWLRTVAERLVST